jgi:TPR repeat protein
MVAAVVIRRLIGPAKLRTLSSALLFALAGVLPSALLAQTDAELQQFFFDKKYARIEELAKAGDARAEAWMGVIKRKAGAREEAKEWYRRAAEKGNRMAISRLALIYQYDHKDLQEAALWYRRGAEAGYAEMQTELARRYLDGHGVPRDEQEAFRWYFAAASRNYPEAYLPVAQLYAGGTGTTRDPLEAYAYGELALKATSTSDTETLEKAEALKKQLSTELSPQQVEEARSRAYTRRPDLLRR